ncbi:MAG: transglycosylase SLT domain-containing protein [Desulfobacterales bacterium]
MMPRSALLFLAAAAALGPAISAAAPPEAAEEPPGLDFSGLVRAARFRGPIDFCGEPAPLHDPEARERLERELLSLLAEPHQVILWIKRGPRHLAPIEEAIASFGLPPDLKYIPIVESALRPHAGSPKGAMGFWQFIEPTGRRYGLQVDRRRDERRNLARSTEAALAYLQQLKELFGSWTLAAAAYNMGENGLQAEIARQETQDFYRLYLPLETQRYVFRILAAKIILENPARFGFRLEAEDLYPPERAAVVEFELRRAVPLLVVARAARTDVKAVKDLNPELRGFELSPGPQRLRIPTEGAEGFARRLAEAVAGLPEPREVLYTVQEGDTLTAIADRHGVSIAEIASWNRLDPKKPIRPGMRLRILVSGPGEGATRP